MSKLAEALVFAVNYISTRDDEADDTYLREDVRALESLASVLEEASRNEQDLLAAAARSAYAAELAAGRSPESREVSELATFMEDMFGEEWEGNDRVEARS